MSQDWLVLPNRHKLKPADLKGAQLLAKCFYSTKKQMLSSAFKEQAQAYVDVLINETKILARVSHDAEREEGIPLRRLVNILQNWRRWLRPIQDYRSTSHNPYRQLAGLMAHLFERYPTPEFLHSGMDGDARYAYVYLQIAQGINIRRVTSFPISLTKTQAHYFHTTEGDLTIVQAAIRAQALSYGMDERYLPALLQHEEVLNPKQNQFWNRFFEFLGRQEMVDPSQIGPLCDFLSAHRVIEDRQGQPAGEFSFKGRTMRALLDRMAEWHCELNHVTTFRGRVWDPTPRIKPLADDHEVWILREILTEKELIAEGKEMRHCVYSYAERCAQRRTSIWTLRMKDLGQPQGRRVATVEVTISGAPVLFQARQKANVLLTNCQLDILMRWARENGIKVGSTL